MSDPLERERALLKQGETRGGKHRFLAYTKLSGPGWLQSAITLGGGSLSTSLFLGILGGTSLLWIQPIAMLLGIVMLCAISYVTLSTGEKPFALVKRHFNPVVAWGWIIATLLANVIWSLPQFSLGTAAVTQNLFPGTSPTLVSIVMLIISFAVVWFYESGSRGIRLFENILKAIVALIVISFIGVVFKMSFSSNSLDWGHIFSGFIPKFSQLTTPSASFAEALAALPEKSLRFWENEIVTQQRGVIFSGVTYAVGINMTFLLPCSLLAKGWDKDFRGLACFDLSTSLLIPFFLATSCIVIASAHQFHAKPEAGLITEIDASGQVVKMDQDQPESPLKGKYQQLLVKKLNTEKGVSIRINEPKVETTIAALPLAEKRLAAMLVKRGALSLASSLEPLMGKTFSHLVFGFGVFAMTLSSIIILMLINGFVLCEMLGVEKESIWHRLGCLLPGIGVLGPFIWKNASFWVVVPTSTIGLLALPLAYLSFFILFNDKKLLKKDRIEGKLRLLLNTIMILAIAFVSFGCVWAAYDLAGGLSIVGISLFILLTVVVGVKRKKRTSQQIKASHV
ncbi:MAG: divalent metal cation transporter [Planctomycetes bacterium]|nr:divalent metal cation transporter [Planctomycetota bacterium]